MKNNPKYVAVITLLVLHLYNIVTGIGYFKLFFTKLVGFFNYSWSNGVYQVLLMLLLLLNLTLITLFFTSTGQYQDRVYKLLRYIFLINFFLHVPHQLYFYAAADNYVYKAHTIFKILHFVGLAGTIACVILFLRARPQTQPPAINLANYERVSHTSMGHRFVHHVLDMLFVLPVFLLWTLSLPRYFNRSIYLMEVLFVLVYLLYYFLSEAIFRQTLGKMATNSCVTSNGPELTGGRILLRTFARLIPFDRLSFLFRANWHDETTYTSVVYIDTWEKAFDESDPADTLATRK